jgi:hypothetical protein
MFAAAWSPAAIGWTLGAVVLLYVLLLASRALQVPTAIREKKALEQAEDESATPSPPPPAP